MLVNLGGPMFDVLTEGVHVDERARRANSVRDAMVGLPPAEIKVLEPALGIQSQPLNATAERALARQMGLSPERYQAVTGRPYPLAQQQAQAGQSAATPGAAPTRPAVPTAQLGVNPAKLPRAGDNVTYADLLKQELARQPNIGLDEPNSAMDRAKLRAGAIVGGLRTDKERRAVRRTKRNG